MVEKIMGLWNSPLYHRACQLLWLGVLLTLTVTSFPILARISHASTVAPLAYIFIFLLAVIWFIPYLLLKGTIPLETTLMIAFLGAALFSSAAAFFIGIPPYRGDKILSQEVEAVITMLLGLGA